MSQIPQVKRALVELYPPESPRPEFAEQLDTLVKAHFAGGGRGADSAFEEVVAARGLTRWRYPLIAAAGVTVIAVIAVTIAGSGSNASPAGPMVATSTGATDPVVATSSTIPPSSVTSVEMPDVTALDRKTAVSRLAELGILVELTVEPEGATIYDSSLVIGQSPAASLMIDIGTRVTLTVQGEEKEGGPVSGAAAGPVEVPDVTGLTYAEAVGVLRAAGLKVPYLQRTLGWIGEVTPPRNEAERNDSPLPEEGTWDPALIGKVVTQVPAAGTEVPAGATAMVNVGSTPTYEVRDYTNVSLAVVIAEVADKTRGRGQVIVDLNVTTDDPDLDGRIARQSAKAGIAVDVDTALHVQVYKLS